jgi:hypothetical protein
MYRFFIRFTQCGPLPANKEVEISACPTLFSDTLVDQV